MLGEPKVAPMAQLVPLASYQVTVEAEREREATLYRGSWTECW